MKEHVCHSPLGGFRTRDDDVADALVLLREVLAELQGVRADLREARGAKRGWFRSLFTRRSS